jgi:hypothetical protein
VNARIQEAPPQTAVGFTRGDFMNFLALQLFTLSHYAGVARRADRTEEHQAALNNISDTLLSLHQLVLDADLSVGEGGTES